MLPIYCVHPDQYHEILRYSTIQDKREDWLKSNLGVSGIQDGNMGNNLAPCKASLRAFCDIALNAKGMKFHQVVEAYNTGALKPDDKIMAEIKRSENE